MKKGNKKERKLYIAWWIMAAVMLLLTPAGFIFFLLFVLDAFAGWVNYKAYKKAKAAESIKPAAASAAPKAKGPEGTPKKHRVAGTQYHQAELLSLGLTNDDYDKTKRELFEEELFDERIYEYWFDPDKVELIPEPDNPNDPNAIKVVVDDVHIGYIKAGSCTHVRNVMEAGNISAITCDIYGGKYKILELENEDDDRDPRISDYTLTKESDDFGATITIYEL